MSRFKVGDRVSIVRCLAHSGFEYMCEHRHCIGSVVTIEEDDNSRMYQYTVTGNGFSWDDGELELVKEGEGKVGRRTFKQIKESDTVKKGAIWQEACDDGTQEYVLLDPTYHKAGERVMIEARHLVEGQPKWFEEVFPATENWLTKDELAAFKKWLKKQK